jgi:hypothetical protein
MTATYVGSVAVETAARIAADLLEQDAATAATDAELAAAIAAVNASMATDAEVAALIAAEAATRAAEDARTDNPHAVTKTQVDLGSVDNTSDAGKPVSTAQAIADALAIPLTQKAAVSGVASLDGSSRVVQAPKLHHADHEPGGADAMTVDAAAATGSLRTLGTGAAQAAQGSLAAPLASPALTGVPTAPTQTAADNSTKVATTAYVDTAGGLLVPKSLVDAKGDLLAGTADNTVARKAVGTNEQSLMADSAQTDGLRWAYPRISYQQRAAMPTGALAEAGVGRYNAMSSQAALTSGILRLGGMCVLPKDTAVASITIPSGSTAAITPTNQWFCLVRVSDLAVLRKTADDLTTAWGASVNKTLSLSSSYTPTADEFVYLGVMVAAGTVPTLLGWSINQSVTFIAPISCGNSTTGLTTPASLGATAAAIGAAAPLSHYGYVS